ncbi:MAG: hypothetical protein H0X65_11905 [Gemmatimonadetes bacterium]|nr:hypothetical protein [Gemmatimonadota bacterium]
MAVEPVSRAASEVVLGDGSHVPCSRGHRIQLRERASFSGKATRPMVIVWWSRTAAA